MIKACIFLMASDQEISQIVCSESVSCSLANTASGGVFKDTVKCFTVYTLGSHGNCRAGIMAADEDP